MNREEQYFSLVKNRILELQEELKKLEQVRRKDDLEIEFIKDKIDRLEKLHDLPLFCLINCLSSEQLQIIKKEIHGPYHTPEEFRAYLIIKFKLEEFPSIIRKSEIPCLADIKNYHTINQLLSLQKKNGSLEQKKEDLSRKILIPYELYHPARYQIIDTKNKNTTFLYHELEHLKRKLSIYEKKLKQMIKELSIEYQIDVIDDVRFYRDNFEVIPYLPNEFLKFHMEKVITRNPKEKHKMLSLVTQKNLTKKKRSRSRKKKEQIFLSNVLEYYQNSELLSFFEIEIPNILDLSANEYKEMIELIKQDSKRKKHSLEELKSNVETAKADILSTTKDYDKIKEQAKNYFSEILISEVGSLPNPVINWLWGVSNLKKAFMDAHSDEEVKNLLLKLEKPFIGSQNKELLNEFVYQLKGK